ncbi:MAG: twitch domain-containing radical SAM protein [Bacteriovoracaceae bacterium]
MGRFCRLPFNGLELSPDGTCQVCCKIDRPILKPDGTKFNLVHDQLIDIWNSEDLQNLRAQFQKGEEPEICSKCWVEESTGNFSLRQQTKDLAYNEKNPKPSYISLKLSNKCNLACRICGPHLSSLWEQEFLKTNKDTGFPEYFRHVHDDKLIGKNLELFHKWAPRFEHVLIYGGEPLINDEVLNFLDHCADSGIARHIHLVLNTNGTMCSDRLISKLSQFKKVSLFLSIDDFGSRFEYQRWPARWDKVSLNLERFCSLGAPFDVRLYPTFSLLNIYYLEEILNELSRFVVPINILNIIHEPAILALRNAPSLMKDLVKRRLSSIDFSRYHLDGEHDYKSILINTIDLPADSKFADIKEWYRAFNWQIGSSDEYRGQHFSEIFPELSKIFAMDIRSTV